MKYLDARGPEYPAMPKLNKFRTTANAAGGVMHLDKFYRNQYAEALEKEIRALQRPKSTYTMPSPRCASGSWSNTPEGMEKAVRARQAREMESACRRDREGRTDETVLALYEAAMREKRARVST